jgi:hypothetical protein
MRSGPLWRLLASANGPIVIGLLQTLLYDSERTLPASLFFEKLGSELETLRDQGDDLPSKPQEYAADWLAAGYVERRFPAGESEEQYELSTSTIDAIRFVSGLLQPHSAATESRLSLVINAVVRLDQETDTNVSRRIEALESEKAKIERQIIDIHQGKSRVLGNDAAIERAREIISLADGLTNDFRPVRDKFVELNRSIREQLLDSDGKRGEILASTFDNYDHIMESEAGRSFHAFWRLIRDQEQSAALELAIENILSRDFITEVGDQGRHLLDRLTRTLLEQGQKVQETCHVFSSNLRSFVQSRQYLEQRRINTLLKTAQQSALSAKEHVGLSSDFMKLKLSRTQIRSDAQFENLYQPDLHKAGAGMGEAENLDFDLERVQRMVQMSEINFAQLKEDIRAVLEDNVQATISEILSLYPARQGLGSIVGLLVLAKTCAYRGYSAPQEPMQVAQENKRKYYETVSWAGADGVNRTAQIPRFYFMRVLLNKLA